MGPSFELFQIAVSLGQLGGMCIVVCAKGTFVAFKRDKTLEKIGFMD